MDAIYDNIRVNYSVMRCTDPKVAEQLYSELQGATRIVNIGAGTGSYEPENAELVAVEPSTAIDVPFFQNNKPVEGFAKVRQRPQQRGMGKKQPRSLELIILRCWL